ncbi:hypothetical protein AJ87_15580 [Rhizobium yanglingense]|nr:hypothetical protein AJ87_15580 [Rhizobium yanglingense]
MNVAAADFADKRNDGVGLTDTRSMEPDKRTLRPVCAGITKALRAARTLFLALGGPVGEIGADDRRGDDPCSPIDAQREPRSWRTI